MSLVISSLLQILGHKKTSMQQNVQKQDVGYACPLGCYQGCKIQAESNLASLSHGDNVKQGCQIWHTNWVRAKMYCI